MASWERMLARSLVSSQAVLDKSCEATTSYLEPIMVKLRPLIPQLLIFQDAHNNLAILRDELLNREVFYTLTEAKELIEQWRKEYNQVRPHSSLGYRPRAPEAIMSVTLA